MKIAVLNGSPKGEMSVTMQYVHFIQKKFPQHELKILNVSERIGTTGEIDSEFQKIINEVESSDGVLWAFPLYVFLVHSQYKRFIELIFKKGVCEVFRNKYAAILTTSIHFYDHTAHNYVNAICDDLEMKYLGSYSADMYDLLEGKERGRLIHFTDNFFEAIESNVTTAKTFQPLVHSSFQYVPGDVSDKIDVGNKKVVILTDSDDTETNLCRMIERFSKSFFGDIKVINLNNIYIKGGCDGCAQCGLDNICSYTGEDEYIEFYNTEVKRADAIIFAGTIRDRYLSSRWKLFFDRAFFNTHTPSLVGKQIGFIISGPLRQIPNLRQIFEAMTEIQKANLVDIITDEYEDSVEIDALLQSLARRTIHFAETDYIKTSTFLGVGGWKIFRDATWGRLRPAFQADHRYYEKHGVYDFPQKDFKMRISNELMILLTKIPPIRRGFQKRIKAEIIKPFQKILDNPLTSQ